MEKDTLNKKIEEFNKLLQINKKNFYLKIENNLAACLNWLGFFLIVNLLFSISSFYNILCGMSIAFSSTSTYFLFKFINNKLMLIKIFKKNKLYNFNSLKERIQ